MAIYSWFSIKNGGSFHSYVKLPEGILLRKSHGKYPLGSSNCYPLVKHTKNLWKDPPFCSWVNQLFRLGHGFNSLLYVTKQVMSGDIDIQRLLSQPDCDAQIIIGLPGLIWCCSRRWDPVLPAHSTTLPWTHPDPLFSRYMNRGNFYGRWDFFKVPGIDHGFLWRCLRAESEIVFLMEYMGTPHWPCFSHLTIDANWRVPLEGLGSSPTCDSDVPWSNFMVYAVWLWLVIHRGNPKTRGLGNLLKFLTMVHMVFPKNRALKLSKLSNGQSNHPC